SPLPHLRGHQRGAEDRHRADAARGCGWCPMTGLADARVVIIGGTSGIGLATARAAVDAGARVVVGGRDPDRLEKAIRELGPAAEGHRVDAASEVELEAFLRRL